MTTHFNRLLVAGMAVLLFAAMGHAGTFEDPRDGKTYKTVKIGNQTWMAENLNYKTEDSYCYKDKESNCQKYGRLYTWKAALKACPAGWHLPSKGEFEALFVAVGGEDVAGKKLKSTSGWDDNGNGDDAFGFSALPAGTGDGSVSYYDFEGSKAYFWSSTDQSDGFYALFVPFFGDRAGLNYYGKNEGFSVRCLKD